MKANQTFRTEDEAVSPVIGVILMVAITVVLAAVVFVLVSNLSDSGSAGPAISFKKDESSDTLTVVKIDLNGLDEVLWSDLDVTGCTAYGTQADDVQAGHQLSCTAGRVTVVHTDTGTLLYETNFN